MANSEMSTLMLAKIKSWDKRQQLLAVLVASLVAAFILNIIFVSPLTAQTNTLKDQQAALQADTASIQNRIQTILADVEQSLANPNSPKSLTYKEQETALDKGLGRFYDEMVTPGEMTEILRQFIDQDSGLVFISMEALPVIDVLAEINITDKDLSDEDRPKLFKRGVTLSFKGSYFDVVNYLKKVENLPKRLMWGELSYTVSEYPTGVVKLTVYTLTSSREWLGA